jgi:hypothetical protein
MTEPIDNAPTGGEDKIEKPITFKDQATLDAIIEDRLGRERRKYADYEDLKLQAAEFQKVKQAAMSETERMTARIAELELATAKQAEESKAAQVKLLQFGAVQKIPDFPLEMAGMLQGETEEAMIKFGTDVMKAFAVGQKSVTIVHPGGNTPAPSLEEAISGALKNKDIASSVRMKLSAIYKE